VDKAPLVYVVLLNWPGWPDTVNCLASLEELDYPNFQAVVVDNASTDESVSRIREYRPNILLIESEKNLGFAGGNNIGIRHAMAQGAAFIWLLNNDTIADPKSLSEMVKLAGQNPRAGAIGSVLYHMNQPQRVQAWGGGRINLYTGRSYNLLHPGSLDFLSAASILLRREALEEVGSLDEEFFMYWEDVDLSLRLRQSGWQILACPEARILHKESASAGKHTAKQDFLFNASAVQFFRRHSPLPILPIWIGLVSRIAKRGLKNQWDKARAVWQGYQQGRSKT
jgi:hypothetical protein